MYSSPPVLHDLISSCTVSAGNTWMFCCFIAYWKVTPLVNGMKKLRLAIKEKLLMTFPKSLFKLLGHFLQKNKILNHQNPIVAPGTAAPSESKRMLRGRGVADVQLTWHGMPVVPKQYSVAVVCPEKLKISMWRHNVLLPQTTLSFTFTCPWPWLYQGRWECCGLQTQSSWGEQPLRLPGKLWFCMAQHFWWLECHLLPLRLPSYRRGWAQRCSLFFRRIFCWHNSHERKTSTNILFVSFTSFVATTSCLKWCQTYSTKWPPDFFFPVIIQLATISQCCPCGHHWHLHRPVPSIPCCCWDWMEGCQLVRLFHFFPLRQTCAWIFFLAVDWDIFYHFW